jgi:glycopeptide antibiotics resistance protein
MDVGEAMSWWKRLVPALILVAYGAVVIKLLVFKIQLLRIGHLRFRFAPEAGQANFWPFKTILAYLGGEPMSLIALLNLVGNVVLLVPIGFLAPFVYRAVTWPACLAVAVAMALAVEGSQVVLGVGIFDIDDVILNSLGVMIGYWAFRGLVRRQSPLGSA